MGKRLKDIYPHATRFQIFKFRLRKFLEKAFLVFVFFGTMCASYVLGGIINTTVAIKEADRIIPPVMLRIAQCESSGSHFRNGQVLVASNTNKSTDVGLFQINSINFKEATKLGYDVFTEQGNTDYAMYIYENRGTEAWHSSAKCWSK